MKAFTITYMNERQQVVTRSVVALDAFTAWAITLLLEVGRIYGHRCLLHTINPVERPRCSHVSAN
jgi:hypothetical protein